MVRGQCIQAGAESRRGRVQWGRVATSRCLAALAAALPAVCQAEGALFTSAFLSFDTDRNPNAVVAADFDRDGVMDVATVNMHFYGDRYDDPTRSTISVRLGHGNGTLGPRVDFETGVLARALTSGDFNGDGHVDLVATYLGSWPDYLGGMTFHRGRGDGTFEPGVALDAGPHPGDAQIADVNGDRRDDLVFANTAVSPDASFVVSILLASGDGSFQRSPDAAVQFSGMCLSG